MRLNLTAVAEANSAARTAAADATEAADPTGLATAFRAVAAHACMSSNIGFDKVLVYNGVGEILDARRYHIARAPTPDAGLAAFESSWDQIDRRIAFEEVWDHGETSVYGALNIGGPGLHSYGRVCLAIDPDAATHDGLAVFPGNTALRYTDAGAVCNVGQATEEATAWPDRGALAAVERSAIAAGVAAEDWPGVICTEDEFLEVVRVGQLPLTAVEEVRLTATTYDELDDIYWRRVAGAALGIDEEPLYEAYAALQSWTRFGVGVRRL